MEDCLTVSCCFCCAIAQQAYTIGALSVPIGRGSSSSSSTIAPIAHDSTGHFAMAGACNRLEVFLYGSNVRLIDCEPALSKTVSC